MTTQEKAYIIASELSEQLGISVGQSYKIIRELNTELQKQGYITVAGKCSRRFIEKKWYGFGVKAVRGSNQWPQKLRKTRKRENGLFSIVIPIGKDIEKSQ